MTERVNVYEFGKKPRVKPKARVLGKAVPVPLPEPEKIVEVKVRRRYVVGRIETEEGRLKEKAVKKAKAEEPEKKLRSHHKAKEPAEPKKKAKKKGA